MVKNRSDVTVGELVRCAREKQDLSIAKLAAMAEVDPRWLSRFERGMYRNPDPGHMYQLADALDLEPITLLSAADYVDGLPNFEPYLRSKYGLPPSAIEQLQAHFELIVEKFGTDIGEDK